MKFLNHIPVNTRPYVLGLLHREHVQIVLSKERNGKWGDFKPSSNKQAHRITINQNLNQYEFFLTLVHEIAHLKIWGIYRHRVNPHGREWKDLFKHYGHQIIAQNLMPVRVANLLEAHLNQPKSSICYDIHLMKELALYSQLEAAKQNYLHDVPIETAFEYQSRVFTKHKSMRTRCLCTEVKTRRAYYIHNTATVRVIPVE